VFQARGRFPRSCQLTPATVTVHPRCPGDVVPCRCRDVCCLVPGLHSGVCEGSGLPRQPPSSVAATMAKNMCYAAQQVLHERDREVRGAVGCPVAMTSKQEKESQGRGTTYWCKSGQDLWKLKTQQPHLFARQGAQEGGVVRRRALPPGFEETSKPGWLYNPERQVHLEEATQRALWFDKSAGVYRELEQGQDLSGSLSLSSGAAAGSAPPSGQQARHVVIMDLHKAAEALKLDLSHFDRPAAMLAVYGKSTGAVPAEVAARALHEKLLKRLCGFLARWPDEALQAAVIESLAAVVSDPAGEGGAATAVGLLLGSRLVAAAGHGATCCLAEVSPSGAATVRHSVSAGSAELNASCIALRGSGIECVFLLTEVMGEEAVAAAARHAAKGRPRAGAIALLREPREGTTSKARASACARLVWAAEEAGRAGQPAKRPRLEPAQDAKVRCRQILLKYVGCRQAVDPVRRRPVRRTQAQAEAALVEVLAEIDAHGDAAFAKQCRAVSECSSSLKGGDLVGDVGWLARPVEKPGEKPSREVASRQAVVRAAFALDVGEVSDVLLSDDGVHVLQRRA